MSRYTFKSCISTFLKLSLWNYQKRYELRTKLLWYKVTNLFECLALIALL